MNHALKMLSPQGGFFRCKRPRSRRQHVRSLGGRASRARREASADEAYSPGSGAVQVSGRWKRAILRPTTRPVRKICKSWCEIRTAMIHHAVLAVRSSLTLPEPRTAKTVRWIISVLALTSPGPLRPPAGDLPPRCNRARRAVRRQKRLPELARRAAQLREVSAVGRVVSVDRHDGESMRLTKNSAR